MADQLDNNTRSQNPDAESDDPLAELARIIGYERPTESVRASAKKSNPSEFDLEAELMRELDVPLAPSVDELDRIEADEALDQALASDVFGNEAGQEVLPPHDEPAVGQMPDENVVDDMQESENADLVSEEGRSSGALLQAIENEFSVENRDDPTTEETTDPEDDLTLAWEADDLAPDWLADKPAFESDDDQTEPDDSSEDAEQRIATEFGAVQTVAATDHSGDDVLEDMVRFELPERKAGTADDQDGLAGTTDNRSGTDTDHVDADTVRPGVAVEKAGASIAPKLDQNGGVTAEPPMDFEEYLSTELDVFGHEVALDAEGDQREGTEQVDGNGHDDELDVEAALDALGDSSLEDDPTIFDDAAEELLASMNAADGISGSAPKAERPEMQGSQEWSLDNIEEATAEELDDELGDMFGLPERVVDASTRSAEESDDLELDLEQVLADSFDEDEEDENEELAGMAANKPDAEDEVEPDTGRHEARHDDRDEMTEAFTGLVPGVTRDTPEVSPQESANQSAPGAIDDQPHQDDWLAGFETSDSNGTASAALSDADDYYFDADLISDADEAVEAVGVIDVPELVHDDPQTFDQDYDTEIEQEFADIADRHEQRSNESSDDFVASGFGVAEVWSRTNTSPRGHEASDDYIALERELGADDEHPVDVGAGPLSDGDHRIEGGYARDETTHRGSRGPVLAVAVLGLALLAVAGAFGWGMMSGDDTTADGGPRIIRADTDPVKVLPENPGGVTVPNQDKAVYDRVAGVDSATPGQPALVNSAEEPVDVVQRTLDPEILPLEGRGDAAVKSEERLTAGLNNGDAGTNGASAPVVSPRKVRTMIVKPDGSIVAREDPEPVAVVEATEQTLTSAGTVLEAPVAPASALETVEPAAAAEAVTTPTETPDETELTSIAPVRVVKTQQIRPVANAPVPAGRPANQPVNVVGTVSQGGNVSSAPAAGVTPAAPAQPVEVASAPVAAAPAANPGGYYVQIASQPTAEGAQASWSTLSSRYSSVLGGNSVDIQRADIPGKGVFHRVRIPAGSKDQANALCSRYKAAGGSCFVSR